jgi:hypothetical protein
LKRIASAFVLLALFASQCVKHAEARELNEIGLLLGARVAADPGVTPKLQIGKSLAFQATFAHAIVQTEGVALALEIPFVALPSQDVHSVAPTAPRNFASIFVTPGIRLKINLNRDIAAWGSIGGGYARFAESTTLVTGTANPFATGTNKGALQFGGGVDLRSPFRLLLPVSFRGEIRDFYSGQPLLNAISSGSGQHNVLISGGLVLKF